MKARYFTIFSYIGTKFRSSEKLWVKNDTTHQDPQSVQGMMEIALIKKSPLRFPVVKLSSRTDGGVHALNSTAHFDLETDGNYMYRADKIISYLNTFFGRANTSIRIKKCIRVSDDFNARFQARSRTYLYRLAVLKKDVTLPENIQFGQIIPIEELDRCHFLRLPNFDIERFREGAKYFIGHHDFGTFRKFSKHEQHKQNRRTICYIEARAGRAQLVGYSGDRGDLFDYWDIEVKGKSFVHNQIRRMVATLITVAVGGLPPEEIKVMLQVPSKHSWYHFIQNCPPQGLYLCNVEYDPKDLVYEPKKLSEEIEDSDSEDELS